MTPMLTDDPGADDVARLSAARPDGAVAERIRARRGGALRPLDEMLLHSPPVADGWNALLGAVRGATTLPADLRELVAMRVAALNDAPYEWDAHRPHAGAAGLDAAALAALAAPGPCVPEPFTETQRRVIDLVDAMTTAIAVPDATFDRLRGELDQRALVELITTVAAYNMVSRFIVALEIGSPA